MKWTRKDISKLSYYVTNFNKQISILAKNPEYSNVTLPEYISYQTLKKQISTRENFNSIVNYLSQVKKPNFIKIKNIDNVSILQGEYRLLQRNSKRLLSYLGSEYQRYYTPDPKLRIFSCTNGKYWIFVF